MKTSNKIAFLVLTCDAYSDLWGMYITLFEKNWPDFPYDKFFVTNFKSIPQSSFNEIKIGEDKSWSHGLIKALNVLKNDYTHVFITLEDLPIVDKVNTDEFIEITNEFLSVNGNYLKFIRKPRPTRNFNNKFGIIEPGSLYRPTCVYALWRIDVFLDLLNDEENAWQFERYGAVRSDVYDKFFVVHNDFFKVLNTVVKGKWVPTELKKIRKFGYNPSMQRPMLSDFDSFKLKIRTLLFNSFTKLFPWKLRRKVVFKLKNL